jgi:hypothetical protein
MIVFTRVRFIDTSRHRQKLYRGLGTYYTNISPHSHINSTSFNHDI